MNAKIIELALRKQRVQFASEHLRSKFVSQLSGVSPALNMADRLFSGARWLRQHPQVFISIGIALIAARPKHTIGWVRRALIGWQIWRKLRGLVTQ